MTKQLDKTIDLAVATELNLATKDHGKHFATPHEGYGVLMEEIWEAGIHADQVEELSRRMVVLMHQVEQCPDAYMHQLDRIKEQAARCAAEMVQVAAMCEKGLRSIRKEREKNGRKAE